VIPPGTFVCEECGKSFRGSPQVSVVGRKLCGGCADHRDNMTAGMLIGGGDPVASAGGFTAFSGMRSWFRPAIRRLRD
jgi:hypothetical protein